MKELLLQIWHSQIAMYIFAILASVILAGGTWLISKSYEFLAGKIKDQKLKELFMETREIVMQGWNSTIREAKQAYVDGKITREELTIIYTNVKKEAVISIKAFVKSKLPKYLRNKYGDTVIGHLIETAISECKSLGLMKKPLPSILKDPATVRDTIKATLKNQIKEKFENPKKVVSATALELECPQIGSTLNTKEETQ